MHAKFLLGLLVSCSLALGAAPATHAAPQSKDQQKCLNGLTKAAAKLTKAQAKEITLCLKNAGKGNLGASPDMLACFTADFGGKVAKTAANTVKGEVKACDPADLPEFAVPTLAALHSAPDDYRDFDADTHELYAEILNPSSVHVENVLAIDLFGESISSAILRSDADKAGASCQYSIYRAVQGCEKTRRDAFGKCVKGALKNGTSSSADLIATCLTTGGAAASRQPDERGKLAKKCTEKIAKEFDKRCAASDVATVLPGSCADAADFAACADSLAACRLCQHLNQAMGFDRDCDLFDDTTANGSCGDVLPQCGDGNVDGWLGEACDDGNLDDGDGCSASCTVESGWYCSGSASVCATSCGDGITAGAEACDDSGESAACNADCSAAACGDAILNVSAGEACDDGGESATCNADCSVAACGDAIHNASAGEACDDGGESAACDADCSLVSCGDGTTNASAGEACDDAGESVTCDADCSLVSCGDGTINASAGEACDDAGESATCDADCSLVTCGDGTTNPSAGEACDDAGESATCDADCSLVSCGDGTTNASAGEACDDAGESASCDADCSLVSCGDGTTNTSAGEACDDAGESASCDADCSLVSCGDGTTNTSAGEACDDAGESATCDADCSLVSCGDGTTNASAGEACDDAGESATCDTDCSLVTCGDGTTNASAGEACDDAGESATCDADCSLVACGDGTTNTSAGEACDDAGESAACDADCSLVTCGDGTTNASAGEACDDAGESASCDTDCSLVSCGDGTTNASAGEACDDAGESATCDTDCSLVSCGDGTTNASAGEACDDAGESANCDADCSLVSCGDGTTNTSAGEACDDAGESASCDADCSLVSCGDGTTNTSAGEACDDAGESATCDSDCSLATCGDGTTNATAGETCDDAGESATCDSDCTAVSCGDGLANASAGEVCDDAGESATCDADCSAVVCGDGTVNGTAGEDCDTTEATPTCDIDCTTPIAVTIDGPTHGSFTQDAVVFVTGVVENVNPADANLTLNGVPVVIQPDGSFSTIVAVNSNAFFNPLLARASRTSTGAESAARVVVIAGASLAAEQHALDGTVLRLDDDGMAVLTEALIAGAPVDLAASLPPGTLILDNFNYGFGTLDMYVSNNPPPSTSGLTASLDSQTDYLTTNFGLNDLFIRMDVDNGANGSIDCRLDITADAINVTSNLALEPDPNDPHLVDATQLGDAIVTSDNANDSNNCGGLLGFALNTANVADTLATTIQDGLNTPDPNTGDLPMEAVIEGVFAGPANDPNAVPDPNQIVETDTPYSAISEDVDGMTFVNDFAATADPADPNAPSLPAFLDLPGIAPVFGATTAIGGLPYDFGFAVSASALNALFRASTEATPPVTVVTDLDFGSGPEPITAGKLATGISAFAALPPATPMNLKLTTTLAPIVTDQAGPSGALADLRVAQVLVDFVSDPGTAQQAIQLTIAVDARLGLDIGTTDGTITLSVGSAASGIASADILFNPLGAQQAGVDALLEQIVDAIVPSLTDALGSIPLSAVLDYDLAASEVLRSGSYLAVYLELQ